MDLLLIALAVVVPVLVGGLVVWLVFRRVGRRYADLFTRLAGAARANPRQMRALVAPAGADPDGIVRRLASMETVRKAEILKTGKQATTLVVTALVAGVEQAFFCELVHTERDGEKTWSIAEFVEVERR